MKKILLILFVFYFSFISEATIHQIQVWNGYYQFLPPNNITVQLGDTIQWLPLDLPTMTHTITSDSIPTGAATFNKIWQLPADTFFQYIPQVIGLYKYVCTPHIHLNMIGEFTVVNGTVLIEEHSTAKELLRTVNILGRETKGAKNKPLIYIYDDGTVEKRIVIE